MKKGFFLIVVALIVAMTGMSVKAQNRMFDKLSKFEGATSVYVGKTMLQLAGSNPNLLGGLGNGNIDMSRLISKLTSVEVITCDNSKKSKKLAKAIEETVNALPDLEIITEVNTNEGGKNDQNVSIYAQNNPATGTIKAIIIMVISEEEPVLVALTGDFQPEDIAAALSGGKEEDEVNVGVVSDTVD